MFGLGWTEMLVVGVVALIVIGPKDLPVVMNRVGKFFGQIRRMGTDFQRELNKASGLDQVTDLRRSITEPLKQTAAEIRNEFNKPSASGGVEPSGLIKPSDPKAESVVKEIHEKIGLPVKQPYVPFTKEAQEKYRAEQAAAAATPSTPAAPATTTAAIDSPAPPEATVTPKKPRAPRKPKAVASADPAAAAPTDLLGDAASAPPKKPRAPRKPKTPPVTEGEA